MRVISGKDMAAVLDWRDLIETLRRAFRSQTVHPDPTRYRIDRTVQTSGALKIDPAWTNFAAQGHCGRGYIGCGLALELPANQHGAEPAGSGVYVLFAGSNGAPLALLDRTYMASWRHAALHALAASYLSREDSSRVLVFGTSPLLPFLLAAYASVREIRTVLISGADDTVCRKLSSTQGLSRLSIRPTDDTSGAISGADIISVVVGGLPDLSNHDISPGLHVDVISPQASVPPSVLDDTRLFVSDRRDAASFASLEIAADLQEIAQGDKAGRRFYGQFTLFKSGDNTGLLDLATAGHIFLRC
ncbi:ornithine cyclodeaminase [Roseibium sp. RKSG952]|uniref:ornithine cyclodeaminase n=1 Tax=Roseibium sp. RKSG952 TaxID=2529384 RepID=UPI0012BCDD6E|nr:ornithine cyclodeaminase [Roseibium sp. RKSG952]MTI00294.1 ornithine cyclodeaminase [Roseibium sp. RKSG952]